MQVCLEKAKKSGDLLVVVKFGKDDKNFNVEKLEWVPKLRELDLLIDAKRQIMSHKGKEVSKSDVD